MKIIIISLVALLVGVGIGWHFGYTHSNLQAAKEVGSVLDAQESGEALAAGFAAEAVWCIDTGDTQKAVHYLSIPIANYWVGYAIHAGTNSQRLKVRSDIEQWALTNQLVALQISNEMIGLSR